MTAGPWLPGGLSSGCGLQPSHGGGLPLLSTGPGAHGLRWLPLPGSEHRLHSPGTRALTLRRPRHLPGQGIAPVSPALAAGFFTTEPPGKRLKSKVFKDESSACLTNVRVYLTRGVPGSSDGRVHLQCRRLRFDPWVGRSPADGNGNPLQDSSLPWWLTQ